MSRNIFESFNFEKIRFHFEYKKKTTGFIVSVFLWIDIHSEIVPHTVNKSKLCKKKKNKTHNISLKSKKRNL